MLFCGSAFGSSWYERGKLQVKNDKIYVHNPYEDPDDSSFFINLSDLKNSTPDFRKCIDNGNYSGIVGIQATDNKGSRLIIDKKSTCKRLDKYDADISTVIGKLERDKNSITIEAEDDMPHFFDIDQLKKAPKEFIQCIDNGNYKGRVEITAQTWVGYRDSVSLRLNSISTCKRK
jgi:hypothetical protein